MTDTAFRERQTPQTEQPLPGTKDTTTGSTSTIEVPYTSYHSQNGHPYLVDHYKLGDTWNESMGGFSQEVGAIEEYVEHLINTGEIGNSLEAVRNKLKSIEKVTNMDKEERAVVKLGVMKSYVKFLMDTNEIKSNLRKYGQPQ